MPGAIALAGIFLVILVEMIFHPCRRTPPAMVQNNSRALPETALMAGASTDKPATGANGSIAIPMMRPIVGRSSSIGRSLSANRSITEVHQESEPGTQAKETDDLPGVEVRDMAMDTLNSEQKLRKERLQCVLLEIGILFHSVFIGMALSVSTGSDFVVLLIAIAFHRESSICNILFTRY